jgi:hypothetical protein
MRNVGYSISSDFSFGRDEMVVSVKDALDERDVYYPPSVVRICDLKRGEGDHGCDPTGSGDATWCQTGNSAGGPCKDGNSATGSDAGGCEAGNHVHRR